MKSRFLLEASVFSPLLIVGLVFIVSMFNGNPPPPVRNTPILVVSTDTGPEQKSGPVEGGSPLVNSNPLAGAGPLSGAGPLMGAQPIQGVLPTGDMFPMGEFPTAGSFTPFVDPGHVPQYTYGNVPTDSGPTVPSRGPALPLSVTGLNTIPPIFNGSFAPTVYGSPYAVYSPSGPSYASPAAID